MDEDEEFRLAVAAKLGLLEILNELRKLREDFNKLYQKSLEHDKRFEAIERKLLEHDKRFEAIEKKLLEHDKKFEAVEKKLLEHDKKFEEHGKRLDRLEARLDRVERELKELRRLVEYNRRDIAALVESVYSRYAFEEIVEDVRNRGEKIVSKKRNARIGDKEVDLLVETDRSIYVVEVKIQPNHEDVDDLVTKLEVAKRMFLGKEVRAILVGTYIGTEIEIYAKSRGIEIRCF